MRTLATYRPNDTIIIDLTMTPMANTPSAF